MLYFSEEGAHTKGLHAQPLELLVPLKPLLTGGETSSLWAPSPPFLPDTAPGGTPGLASGQPQMWLRSGQHGVVWGAFRASGSFH